MTKNEVATRPKNLKELVETPGYANRFKELLKDRAPQFVASLIQVGQSYSLKDCDPNSIIAAAITAAALDLPISPQLGFAHIVGYAGRASFQIGYKGYIQLCLRSGQYQGMNAKPINAEALVGYDDIGDALIDWPKLDETKEAVGYAFAFRLSNGFRKTVFWTAEKCIHHAKRYSKGYNSTKFESLWKTNPEAMSLKTVILDGIRKWGIMSIDMQRAVEEDGGSRATPESSIEYLDGKETTKPDFGNAKEITVESTATTAENPFAAASDDGDLGPAIAPVETPKPVSEPKPKKPAPPTPAPVVLPNPPDPVEAQETGNDFIKGTMIAGKVSFDDYRDWLKNAGHYADAETMNDWGDLPENIANELAKHKPGEKSHLAKCVKIYGKAA